MLLRLLGLLLRLEEEEEEFVLLLAMEMRRDALLGDAGGGLPCALPLVSRTDDAAPSIAVRVTGADSLTMLAI